MTQKDFKDYEIKCIKCSKPFIVTAAQQKGTLLPKYCPHCRNGVKSNMHAGKKLNT